MKYKAKPFIGNRGELHKLGRLNHASTKMGGCSELDWIILRSGHDPDYTTLLQACGEDLTIGARWGVVFRGRTYQMEFGAPCLIGISAPTVGCRRPQ